MIGKSYKEWQESPIATSITTHPIEQLNFPVVSICPPRESNTALYHDLVQVGNQTLSTEHVKTLKKSVYKHIFEQSHKEYVERMVATSNMRNVEQVYLGFHSLPQLLESGNEIRLANLNSTITTPWLGGEFVEEYYREGKDYHMVLELPDDISDHIEGGFLKIELEVDTRILISNRSIYCN